MMLSIGDLVLDITIKPERRLKPDDDTASTITVGGGGQAANFCAWATHLGQPARLVTRVGDDDSGRRLVGELEAAGVEVFAVRGKDATGAIAVIVGPDGDRTMATQRGASVRLTVEELRPEWFKGVKLIHVPAYSLFREPLASAARAAVEYVRDDGGILSMDLSSVAGLLEYGPARMAADLGWLKPEVLFVTTAEADTLGVPTNTLAKLVVMKLGPSGCSVGGQMITAPPARVVDPTGAGDAFAAAFCAATLKGATPVQAGERAVRVASVAVATLGARPK
jgi:ribokinase